MGVKLAQPPACVHRVRKHKVSAMTRGNFQGEGGMASDVTGGQQDMEQARAMLAIAEAAGSRTPITDEEAGFDPGARLPCAGRDQGRTHGARRDALRLEDRLHKSDHLA